MLRDAWFLSRSDLRLLLRERETLLWAFVMPVLFFYFIGKITQGSGQNGDRRDLMGVYAPADSGYLVESLTKRLETAGYQIKRVEKVEDLGEFRRQLVVPEKFTDHVLAGTQAKLHFQKSSNELGGDYDQFRINSAAYSLTADLIVLTLDGSQATPERFADLAARPRSLTVKHEPTGKRQEIPSGFQQSVPGMMVFLAMLVMSTTASALVTDREQGLLRRLASSPMSRGAVVTGKWGARVLLSLLQVGVAMIVGALWFKIQWGPHYVAVAAILLAYIGLAAAIGMILGTVCRTQSQAIAFGVTGSNIMAALGGCWWPVEITPDWCQTLAKCLPTGWVMDALHQLLNFGADPSVVWPHLAALVISTLVAGWWLKRNFRFM